MKNLIATLAGFCAFGLLSTTPALGQAATDVNCDGCVHSGDIATNGVRREDIQNFSVNTPKLSNFAVTKEKIKTGAVTADKIAAGAVGITQVNPGQVQLRVSGSCAVGSFITSIAEDGSVTCGTDGTDAVTAMEAELQNALDYGRKGMSAGSAALNTLEQLIGTLGLTCAETNYKRFFGCTQITAGDGTVWPIANLVTEYALARITIEDAPQPPGAPSAFVYMAQTIFGEVIVGGTANFLRWTYRDSDDTARLVDDCDNPTVAMGPVALGVTSSRWRINNGEYYYVPFNTETGEQDSIGEIDVTGQMVGIVRNVNPFSVFDAASVVWCEMSNRAVGLYNKYELLPYSFNLNEARFSLPLTAD